MKKTKFGSDWKMYSNLGIISQVGLIMLLPIVAGLWVGNFVDERLGTGGIGLLVGILLGVVTAFMNLFKLAMRQSRDKKEK